MPNFVAMSFEGSLAPTFELVGVGPGHKPPDGWGIGCYPGEEPAACVLKEPAPSVASARGRLIAAMNALSSSIFVAHVRTATWGPISDANTQPFQRPWGRRDWLMAHSGSLDHRLELASRFEPVGGTDSEQIFCEMLARIANQGWRSLGEIDPVILRDWFDAINDHGSMTTVLTDGRDLVVYADRNGIGPVHVWQLMPPHGAVRFGDDELIVDLTRRGVKSRKGIIVSATALASLAETNTAWRPLAPGSLLVVRQGAIRAELPRRAPGEPAAAAAPSSPVRCTSPSPSRPPCAATRSSTRRSTAIKPPSSGAPTLFRLTPTHDRLQTVISNEVSISVDGRHRDYEDVFGNRIRRYEIDQAYEELAIVSRSRVEVSDTDPLSFKPLRASTSIPLVWMPWQRHMLDPYILPPELPESELVELVEYAMSFVERNDYDLLDTLLDINATLFREYKYEQGSSSLSTTAFETYANRRGVCQDFTNLFICLARLLGVPARYVCGYLWTGPKHENRVQSEASHAWVQLYLPELGWKGCDPTNGILTQTEHIRVAVGRTSLDATPTSGTIYVGGGPETLEVSVIVDPV